MSPFLARTRARVGEWRRTTFLGPFLDAWMVRGVLRALDEDPRRARVLGPEEFAPYLRCLTPFGAAVDLPVELHDWVIVHQAKVAALPSPLLRRLHDRYRCVLANRRYMLFRHGSPENPTAPMLEARARIAPLLRAPQGKEGPVAGGTEWSDRAIVVTTFERPAALERTLPQVCRLGAAVLLVDDGSRHPFSARNEALARDSGAAYLHLPSNRGLSAALNVGLAYLLADRRVEWISVFQDDVDVRPDALRCLRRVEDPVTRPILTGYDADEHPAFEEVEIAGLPTRLKRESPGVHLHAHRDYWRAVLPIPTEYRGAPKRGWEASLEDSWITTGAPSAAARRGIPVVCLPGLVRTFLWHSADSTWGNPNDPEDPLTSEPEPGEP